MPQYDFYHNTVKTALLKDGWIITEDPFTIEFEGVRLYADLGAEKLFSAEKSDLKIAVEVKVFAGPSLITDLQKAVGQYGIYRSFLSRTEPERQLFLAIAQDIYQDFFERPAIQAIVDDYQIQLLIFEPKSEEVIEWIN